MGLHKFIFFNIGKLCIALSFLGKPSQWFQVFDIGLDFRIASLIDSLPNRVRGHWFAQFLSLTLAERVGKDEFIPFLRPEFELSQLEYEPCSLKRSAWNEHKFSQLDYEPGSLKRRAWKEHKFSQLEYEPGSLKRRAWNGHKFSLLEFQQGLPQLLFYEMRTHSLRQNMKPARTNDRGISDQNFSHSKFEPAFWRAEYEMNTIFLSRISNPTCPKRWMLIQFAGQNVKAAHFFQLEFEHGWSQGQGAATTSFLILLQNTSRDSWQNS